MPIPKPRRGEGQDRYLSRCIGSLREEGYGQQQAAAICFRQWRQDHQGSARDRWFGPKPDPLREIPAEVITGFDRSLRWRNRIYRMVVGAFESLASGWLLADVRTELVATRNLEGMLEGSVGASLWRRVTVALGAIWESPIDRGMAENLAELPPAIRTYLTASQGAAAGAPIPGNWWSLDYWRQTAATWARASAANKITGINGTTKAGIREIVARAFAENDVNTAIAKILQAMDGDGKLQIGLDRRRANIFYNFIENLDPDLSPAKRAQLIRRRYQKLLRQRMELIAHTEAMDAANEAQLVTLEQAAREGLIDPLYELEWVTRTVACARCKAFDGQRRAFGFAFFRSDGSGPYGVETAFRPEIHPGGYCMLRTVRRLGR